MGQNCFGRCQPHGHKNHIELFVVIVSVKRGLFELGNRCRMRRVGGEAVHPQEPDDHYFRAA